MQAILLLNLGSPNSPNTKDVRTYLDEFLMDPYVIDLPYLLRALIVKGLILPSRPKQSAKAYASIWTEDGSPLIVISQLVSQSLADQIEKPVVLAMRYGNPSITDTLKTLFEQHTISKLLVIPLYPQYAMSTVKTGIVAVENAINKLKPSTKIQVLPPFYQDDDYIAALSANTALYLQEEYDHLLFSYHGLPERHLTKTDPTNQHCLKQADCCKTDSVAHATCYRHQCFKTTEKLVNALDIPPEKYSVAFQSRLGKAKWLEPYTENTIKQLAHQGVKKLLVICPAFVADCIETLEEIGIRGQEIFQENGGDALQLIPCLNNHPKWIETLATWCDKESPSNDLSEKRQS